MSTFTLGVLAAYALASASTNGMAPVEPSIFSVVCAGAVVVMTNSVAVMASESHNLNIVASMT